MSGFVHLRLHSEYSLRDSLITLPELVARCIALGMPAVAVSDQDNLFALIKFYTAALGKGLQPLVAADLTVHDAQEPEGYRALVLARSLTGYRRLVELVSLAHVEGGREGNGIRVHRRHVDAQPDGLLVLSGGRDGDVGKAILAGQPALARARAAAWQARFGDAFYLELVRTGRAGEEECLHGSVEIAAELGIPVVATNDVVFLARDDFEAHETRVCIQESRTLNDPRRVRRYSAEQYLKTPDEMAALFEDVPEAIANSVAIARRCAVLLELGKYRLPEYPIPGGESLDSFFERSAREGLEARLAVLLRRVPEARLEAACAPYLERLELEMHTIERMGFVGYFLIVMEFIGWAKQNGIPVGPGRGSGAGSLVAYALGITDLDPLAYDLLFERFLNPERVSMPDFDIDFCMDGRDRVIQHVAERYGADAVSQIITFGTMAAKAVVRDVARVQGKSYGLADRIAKLIPFEVNMTLEKAIAQEPELRSLIAADEDVAEIWEMATKLEGIVRNTGKHAAGVVIAPTKLTDFVPLARDDASDGLVAQFDKDDVEKAGLVKFDFLGLKTLTIIDWAVRSINADPAHGNAPPVDIASLTLDDPAVYALFKRADTNAVFQLESRGMRDLIRKLKPDTFEDIVALVALYRPGPMDLIPDFIERKHGRQQVEYLDPRMEPILRPTYGVMVYQEQVMQIAQVIGGYSLGGADLLRRAMGKKLPEEMAQHRVRFTDGAGVGGVDAERAGQIFDHMEKFAGYGFNKSHSAAYALISYQTAWLKTHYRAHFMAAVLSGDLENTDKIVPVIDECRRAGLRVLPPDVNSGQYRFTVHEGDIRYGLGAIKGVGEGTINAIVEAREKGGRFRDLHDFCRRIDDGRLNKRALEAFVRCGALDGLYAGPAAAPAAAGAGTTLDTPFLNECRGWLLAQLPIAVQAAEQLSRNAALGMTDLFGDTRTPAAEAALCAPHRPLTQRERISGEKDTLGLYLTGHPIDEYAYELRAFCSGAIAELAPSDRKRVVAGLLTAIRFARNKRGDPIAILQLEDRSERMEVTVFGELLSQVRPKLVKDQVLIAEGAVLADDFSGGVRMRADAILTITEARARHADALRIRWCGVDGDAASRLQSLLEPYRGIGCPVVLDYQTDGASIALRLGRQWQVQPSDELLLRLRASLGDSAVRMVYADDDAA